MSYTINNTRGSVVTTVTPGTTQVVGGITLIGKNYTGYGELIAEDFVKILENQNLKSFLEMVINGGFQLNMPFKKNLKV